MKPTRTLLLSLSLLSSLALGADAPVAPASRCGADQLVFATGVARGAYGQMGHSIAEACPMVCETDETQGGRDNLEGVAQKRFDLGISQVDAVAFLSELDPELDRSVRSLASLHNSYLHVITLRAGVAVTSTESSWGGLRSKETQALVPVRAVSELKGKPVAVWSSALITTTLINKRLGLDLQLLEVKSWSEGLKLVREQKAWALFAMGGKPTDWVISDVDPATFTLVPLDDAQRLGPPYIADKLTYSSLGLYGLPTVRVRNEIIVRNITGGPLLPRIEAFSACLASHLEEIKNARGTHPAWRDVEELSAVTGRPFTAPDKGRKAAGGK